MQSGILDKNGKMICYGDRVRFDASRDGSRPALEGIVEPLKEVTEKLHIGAKPHTNGFQCPCEYEDAGGDVHKCWMYFVEEQDNICEDATVLA